MLCWRTVILRGLFNFKLLIMWDFCFSAASQLTVSLWSSMQSFRDAQVPSCFTPLTPPEILFMHISCDTIPFSLGLVLNELVEYLIGKGCSGMLLASYWVFLNFSLVDKSSRTLSSFALRDSELKTSRSFFTVLNTATAALTQSCILTSSPFSFPRQSWDMIYLMYFSLSPPSNIYQYWSDWSPDGNLTLLDILVSSILPYHCPREVTCDSTSPVKAFTQNHLWKPQSVSPSNLFIL